MQHTLKYAVTIEGIGLHSGCQTKLTLHPAPINSGIVFCRSDMAGKPTVPALYSNVVDTRNCTCLSSSQGAVVSTIEHLMAALYILGIDNALIEVDNRELPIMDGSALPFYEILSQAELQEQNAKRKYLRVKKTLKFEDGKGGSVVLEPSENFAIHFEIEFPSKIVGHQTFDAPITQGIFAQKIAPCRTFCEKYQVDYLRSIGLIKGGSLDNAVVLDGETLLNPEGFRVDNECVNHKTLDAVGDMYTSGYPILGKLTAQRSGHYHNNELLKQLFADSSNYEIVEK